MTTFNTLVAVAAATGLANLCVLFILLRKYHALDREMRFQRRVQRRAATHVTGKGETK